MKATSLSATRALVRRGPATPWLALAPTRSRPRPLMMASRRRPACPKSPLPAIRSAEQTVAPSSVLSGENLLLQRAATLGDTLQNRRRGQPRFGPNAGRPSIRGLDGDRVRILQNSGASVDASSLSYDHNTPIDPLAVERVEVRCAARPRCCMAAARRAAWST